MSDVIKSEELAAVYTEMESIEKRLAEIGLDIELISVARAIRMLAWHIDHLERNVL